jgi:replication factor A1
MSLDEVIDQIHKKSKSSKEDITKKVDEIHGNYSGLITKEGAALILAKEMGVEMQTNQRKRLQIKNIIPGMRNVNFVGKITRISPVNSFEKQNGKKGRVCNLFVADSSGYVRLPLWNEQVELVENESLKIGDIVQVANAMSKENIYGDVEISVGKFGMIKRIDESDEFVDVKSIERYMPGENMRVKIASMVPGNFDVKATITRVFRGKFTFDSDGEPSLVISCLIEDDSGEMRAVFFRETAEKLCGISAKEMESMDMDQRFERVSRAILGRELMLSGRAQMNKMSEAMELVVNSVKDINTLDESTRILEDVESRLV